MLDLISEANKMIRYCTGFIFQVFDLHHQRGYQTLVIR